GIPYRWGGNNVAEGLDCSGFTKAIYNLCGINIPRTSDAQMREGYPVDDNEIEEGDLVFFGNNGRANHVGIYIGDGKMVHAPKRNDEIKIADIKSNYFKSRFLGARRYW
ncbi:MAG: C40 family peptidase, partial [Proteobacteria bacterium]|nr:C40 family peptidase [Pseudomonadota bacterium]